MHSSRSIANYFLDRGDEEAVPITPMKVIKLTYLAHGWYLAFTGDALVNEDVEAWTHGPVLPSVYHSFKKWGSFPIDDDRAKEWHGLAWIVSSVYNAPSRKSFPLMPFLEKAWDIYKGWSPAGLRKLTHMNGSPWHTVKFSNDYKGKRDLIPNALIYSYYKKKLDE